ncbi:MAG TPA: metal-sulfur cluster assembly factor [Polyangia bacterium]|nr:metal-sulfur cluster assembly factor [Polyangia bacterium]
MSALDAAALVEQAARDGLLEVHDPETDLNLVDLGLIYRVTYRTETRRLEVLMTLTTPACPAGGIIVDGVQRRLALLADVDGVDVELTFDPPWTPDRISPEGRAFLGA